MKLTHRNKLLFFLIALILTSCDYMKYKNKPQDASDLNVNEWNEAKHPNLKPMYGNIEKSAEEKANDKEYVDAMLKDNKMDTTSAAKSAMSWGWYYFFHNKIDTAMFRFNQCWLIDSTYPESYFGFAAIREYRGLTRDAEKFYQLAFKHDKTDTLSKQILNKIAEIKEQQKDTIAMLKAYQRAYNQFPKNDYASGKLGYFYSILNQSDSSIKYYNITININPEYFQTYINRGWYYRNAGKIEEAISDFSTAIKKNNISPNAYANRYSTLMSVERYKEALLDIKKCIELVPQEAVFHKDLAECYFQLNMKEDGCKELDIAIKRGDKNAGELKKKKC